MRRCARMRWPPTTRSCRPHSLLAETTTMSETTMNPTELRARAADPRLHGLLAHWSEVMAEADAARRVAQWLAWETQERGRRSLERRLREAHIGRFKPLADFD